MTIPKKNHDCHRSWIVRLMKLTYMRGLLYVLLMMSCFLEGNAQYLLSGFLKGNNNNAGTEKRLLETIQRVLEKVQDLTSLGCNQGLVKWF